RVISATDPDRAAAWLMAAPALQGRIALFRNRAPEPAILARLLVIGCDVAAAIGAAEPVAADQDLAVRHQRRNAGECKLGSPLGFPDLRPGARIQRQDMAVIGGDIDP